MSKDRFVHAASRLAQFHMIEKFDKPEEAVKAGDAIFEIVNAWIGRVPPKGIR